MLSRTADHLYWMSRYSERAESLARLLDAHYRRSLLPRRPEAEIDHWRATLDALGIAHDYQQRFGEIDPERAFAYIAYDRESPASILSLLRNARENARAVRGTITAEMWETLNSTYLELRNAANRDPGEFLEWVKYRSHLSRGVTVATMLRDEAFHFTRIGAYVERADHLPRLLKSYWRPDGRIADAADWAVLLRALSAFEIYRRIFRESVTPRRVAELLLLRGDLPRSLLRCLSEIVTSLAIVRNEQSGETERRAGALRADLYFARMNEFPDAEIPALLTRISARVRDVASGLAENFLAAGQ